MLALIVVILVKLVKQLIPVKHARAVRRAMLAADKQYSTY